VRDQRGAGTRRGSVLGLFGMGRLRVESPSAEPPWPGPRLRLTRRRCSVLRLLAEGLSAEEIASQLKLSQTTVQNHVVAVIAALGVHTSLQAVIEAQRAGLLRP
jgi:DNA-binding NarL/FixJ family response regulator